jgi:NAD(P)-dependent dehydrogenase (short-subunit alcohol dehydrogenase family)
LVIIRDTSSNHNDINPASARSLRNFWGNVAIVTGAAGGIGSGRRSRSPSKWSKVILADLLASRAAAEKVIASLSDPNTALFIPADILSWNEMQALFEATIEQFGHVDIVAANEVIGLLRASQKAAAQHEIRVNAVSILHTNVRKRWLFRKVEGKGLPR